MGSNHRITFGNSYSSESLGSDAWNLARWAWQLVPEVMFVKAHALTMTPFKLSERFRAILTFMFVPHVWQEKEEQGVLKKTMTSLPIRLDFFSGYPLNSEITQQRGNEWDPCCTLYFHNIPI